MVSVAVAVRAFIGCRPGISCFVLDVAPGSPPLFAPSLIPLDPLSSRAFRSPFRPRIWVSCGAFCFIRCQSSCSGRRGSTPKPLLCQVFVGHDPAAWGFWLAGYCLRVGYAASVNVTFNAFRSSGTPVFWLILGFQGSGVFFLWSAGSFVFVLSPSGCFGCAAVERVWLLDWAFCLSDC